MVYLRPIHHQCSLSLSLKGSALDTAQQTCFNACVPMKRQFLHEHHNRQEKAWKERGNGGYYGASSSGDLPKVWEKIGEFDWSTDPPSLRWKHRYNEKVDE